MRDAFQKAEWTMDDAHGTKTHTPGWDKAREVIVALNSVADPTELDFEQKIHLITVTMQAATQSDDWVEFLIAVSDVLTGT